MKLSMSFCLLIAAQLFLCVVPACASDEAGKYSGSTWSKIAAVPRTTCGVIYGVTLGVPIRAAKYIHSESHRMTETLLDDYGGPGFWNMMLARSCGIPYGIASGTILGVVRGVQYGGQYGAEEPFSKKSIGIDDPCLIGQR